MLFNPRIFNARVFNVGAEEPRGHTRHRRKKYIWEDLLPETQIILEKESQDELALQAARIALEELEQEEKTDELRKRYKALSDIEKRIEELQAQSLYVQAQAEILKELIEIQRKRFEDEDDIEAILMLL